MNALLERLEPRQIPLLAAAVLLIVAAALVSYAILPQYRARAAAHKERLAVEQQLLAGGGSGTEMSDLQAAIERLEQSRDGAEHRLTPPLLQTEIMARLQESAQRRALVLETMLPTSGKPIGGVRETLVQIELTGSFAGVRDWLVDLRSTAGPVVVRELALAPVENVSPDPLLRASLVIVAFGSPG